MPKLNPAGTAYRPVNRLTTAQSGFEGEGFPVRRSFVGVPLPELDPFVHMDHLGEAEQAPGEARGTPWHPHRGFETVTYIIDGALEHQDSHGGGGHIADGDTQWMTAGSGILHIEKPPEQLVRSGRVFHSMQLWVNLPRAKKMSPPRYQDIRGKQASLITSPDGGALIRVIAGDIAGHAGLGVTHTPITIAHITLEPGAQVDLPWDPSYNALAYALAGHGTVGSKSRPFQMGQLAVFGAGDALPLAADQNQQSRFPKLEVFVPGGLPIPEPVFQYGPFVMNTQDEVLQAFEDYQAGSLGVVPAQPLPHTP